MKKIIVCIFILIGTIHCTAQSAEELTQSASEYFKAGQYDKAESLFLEAKKIREQKLGKENADYANSCTMLALTYYAQSKYTEAVPLYVEAMNIKEKVYGKSHREYLLSCKDLTDALTDQGIEYYGKGQYANAEPLWMQVKNIQEQTIGKENVNYASTINNLAALYMDLGMYDKSEPLFLESKSIRLRLLGKDDPQYANSCNSLGDLYIYRGKFDAAELAYIEAKAIREKAFGKNHVSYISSCNNLAALYMEQGLYSKAEPYYLEAISTVEKLLGKEHEYYAGLNNNLANLYELQGFYIKSETLHINSKNIQQKILGKEHPDYAKSCNNLGLLYYKQGLYKKAEPLYLEAKAIQANTLGPDYASSCNNLAILYTDQGLFSKAEPFYLESKNLREKIVGKEHYEYAESCLNLSNLYENLGQFSKAEPFCIEAKSILLKSLGKEHPKYANACVSLAQLYFDQKLTTKAEPLFLEAIAIQEKALGTDHPDYARSCNTLAGFYYQQGLYAKAEPLYKKTLQNKLKQIDELLPTLSEKERDDFYKSISYFFSNYYEFVLKAKKPALYADLFNLQLQIKGIIFQSTQKMHSQIMNSGDANLINKYESWKAQRKKLNTYMLLSTADRGQKKINTDSLTTVINDLEKSLSTSSEIFASTQSKKKYNWKDVQKKLMPNEAAIEIIRTDSAYIALIVTPLTKDNPEAVVLKNGIDLEKKFIKYYRNCIKDKTEDDLSYVNFWKPIQDKLPNVSKVYVSADGVYHQLNLLTLKNPATKKYVLDETSIQLVSNLKDLLSTRPKELATRYEDYKIHLIAYPKYDDGESGKISIDNPNDAIKKDSTQRFYDRGGKITMLPGTKEEANNIVTVCAKQNIQPEVRMLAEATEEYLKSLKNPTILHIATHGFFMASQKVSVKKSRSLTEDEIKLLTKDPLQNSGLLFANAQQGMTGVLKGGEDGILTAKEALNLNLDKTELVIMSACETGLGEIRNGEGVYGLQRSFQQAGAKTIVISLWKVSDAATQELMSNFYDNHITKKMNKREAFKQAQLDLRAKYSEPYYWGAFVIVGE